MRPLQPATVEAICARLKGSNEITVGAFLFTVRLSSPLFRAMSDAIEQADREDWHDDTLAAVMEGLLMMYQSAGRPRVDVPLGLPGKPQERPGPNDGPGFMDTLTAVAEQRPAPETPPRRPRRPLRIDYD